MINPRAHRPRLRFYLGKPCSYCGGVMHHDAGRGGPKAPSRDHRVPAARLHASPRGFPSGALVAGVEHPSNITICCRFCNEEKGVLTTDEYMAWRAGMASRLDYAWNAARSLFAQKKPPLA